MVCGKDEGRGVEQVGNVTFLEGENVVLADRIVSYKSGCVQYDGVNVVTQRGIALVKGDAGKPVDNRGRCSRM